MCGLPVGRLVPKGEMAEGNGARPVILPNVTMREIPYSPEAGSVK